MSKETTTTASNRKRKPENELQLDAKAPRPASSPPLPISVSAVSSDLHRKERHRASEQRRREKLNSIISELAELLPESFSERVDKVSIVSQAVTYTRELKGLSNKLLIDNQDLIQENNKLKVELAALRSYLIQLSNPSLDQPAGLLSSYPRMGQYNSSNGSQYSQWDAWNNKPMGGSSMNWTDDLGNRFLRAANDASNSARINERSLSPFIPELIHDRASSSSYPRHVNRFNSDPLNLKTSYATFQTALQTGSSTSGSSSFPEINSSQQQQQQQQQQDSNNPMNSTTFQRLWNNILRSNNTQEDPTLDLQPSSVPKSLDSIGHNLGRVYSTSNDNNPPSMPTTGGSLSMGLRDSDQDANQFIPDSRDRDRSLLDHFSTAAGQGRFDSSYQ